MEINLEALQAVLTRRYGQAGLSEILIEVQLEMKEIALKEKDEIIRNLTKGDNNGVDKENI